MRDYEKKIIKNRLSGVQVYKMKEDELKVLGDVCIFKIAAISGFSLSTDGTFSDVLRDEFLTFLNEYGFGDLTFDEIITAFRFNAHGNIKTYWNESIEQVKPYSSFFNLNYAGEVLNIYMKLRNLLDSRLLNEDDLSKYIIDSQTKTI